MRFQELSRNPVSLRSPRSSAARRLPATCARMPIRELWPGEFERAGAAAVSVLVDERFAGSATTCGRAGRSIAPLLAKGSSATRTSWPS
jgi:hypothetical protein